MVEQVILDTYDGPTPVLACLAATHGEHSKEELQLAHSLVNLIEQKAGGIVWCAGYQGDCNKHF